MLVREQMTFQNAAESRHHNSNNITFLSLKKFSIKARRDFKNWIWNSSAVYQKNDFQLRGEPRKPPFFHINSKMWSWSFFRFYSLQESKKRRRKRGIRNKHINGLIIEMWEHCSFGDLLGSFQNWWALTSCSFSCHVISFFQAAKWSFCFSPKKIWSRSNQFTVIPQTSDFFKWRPSKPSLQDIKSRYEIKYLPLLI